MTPQQWIAAANMVQRRGERLRVVPVTVQAYELRLPDGTALSYVDHPMPRAFRSVDQAVTAVDRFDLSTDATALQLP